MAALQWLDKRQPSGPTEDIIRTRDGPMCGSFGHLVFYITKYLVTVSEGKVKPPNSTSPWLERKVIKDQITKAVSWGGGRGAGVVSERSKVVEKQVDFI